MDLNNLRNLSQKGQDDIAKQILQKCNPQSIARELISNLEKNATEAAQRGERKAFKSFTIWSETKYGNYRRADGSIKYGEIEKKGPLVDFPDREKASEILFEMVQECVAYENIQLTLDKNDTDYNNSGYRRACYISASVEW